MGLIGTKKHPNNQQRAAKRGLGWVGVQGSGYVGARGGKRESVRGETEDGLPPERQRQASLSLPLCLCQGLFLSSGPVGIFLLISASFPLSLCDLHTNTPL